LKGYVRVKNFPSNRYSYLLTPQGIAEKSRLAYQHLSYFTGLYTVARQDFLTLFQQLAADGVREVAFCGVDEVAEIAYLSLQETDISLLLVMDNCAVGSGFFGRSVQPVAGGVTMKVVITSLKRAGSLRAELLQAGVAPATIITLGCEVDHGRGNAND
jgi:hypothetical protein